MEENFSMECNMEWKIFSYEMEMEWKKIASMKYEKIVFHFIPCPGCCSAYLSFSHRTAADAKYWTFRALFISTTTRGGVLEDVLEDTF